MTVKLTSAKSRCVVFLMTFMMAHCVPLDFTTSRYSEETELHDNKSLLLPFNSDSQKAPEIFHIKYIKSNFSLPRIRRSKGPQDEGFYSEEFIRNFDNASLKDGDFLSGSTPISLETDSRKFKNDKIDSLSKKNSSNSNISSQFNSTKFKSTNSKNSSLYSNFVTKAIRHTQTHYPVLTKQNLSSNKSNKIDNKKNISRKPGVFEIKLPKPTVTRAPAKFMTVTHKPIVITLTKVPSYYSSSQFGTKPTIKTTRTPGWISKIKSSTPMPVSSTKSNIYGWPNTKIKNKNDLNRYKNYTNLNITPTRGLKKPNSSSKKKPSVSSTISPNRKKPKPTRVKYVPRPGHKPTIEEIKQNWYESGVPYPNPMPEISSNTPAFGFSPPGNPVEEDLDSVEVDATGDNALTNAISSFNLDMRPAATNVKDTFGSSSGGCPTVHISSSVLSPQQRQECSDLNLVINSHFHQNTASDRTPTIDTYQAESSEEDIPVEAVEDPVEEVAQSDTGLAQADPGGVQADPGGVQADSAGGSPGGTGGSGANGGSGGSGGDGGDSGGLGWPDIKGMLDAADWLGNKFGYLFSFLKNPYLYLIPAALFFLIGFFLIIALFPWWVPLLFLFVGIKAKHKPNIVHHKHVHKAVHHPDGWFWNHESKTWENVQDYLHRRRISNVNINHIPQAIDQFGKKYGFESASRKTLKKIR